MADMNDELSLVWKPVEDFIIDNTLNDLAVKFSKNWVSHTVICSNFLATTCFKNIFRY